MRWLHGNLCKLHLHGDAVMSPKQLRDQLQRLWMREWHDHCKSMLRHCWKKTWQAGMKYCTYTHDPPMSRSIDQVPNNVVIYEGITHNRRLHEDEKLVGCDICAIDERHFRRSGHRSADEHLFPIQPSTQKLAEMDQSGTFFRVTRHDNPSVYSNHIHGRRTATSKSTHQIMAVNEVMSRWDHQRWHGQCE